MVKGFSWVNGRFLQVQVPMGTRKRKKKKQKSAYQKNNLNNVIMLFAPFM